MMDVSWPDMALHVLTIIFAGGAVYGAIRSDLRNMRREISEAKEAAQDAHRRINDLLMRK